MNQPITNHLKFDVSLPLKEAIMSTELQRQVSSIRKQHLAVVPLHQGRPSLFLTAAEAAGVDVSTIHEAAQSGLATLQQYDPRFEPFLENLLHPSSVDLQRETKTAAENKALDVQINALLKLLSLYALETSAHLVLEYLIRRYRIHEMNTNELIQSMLVAHDTKIFARIIQLCQLEDSLWVFLQGVKTSGVPLPRAALVQRALKDAQLLELLSQYTQSALELVVQRPGVTSTSTSTGSTTATPASAHSLAGANRILSFYAAVVLEMAEERPFDDTRVRHVYLFLVEGLKNKYQRRGGSSGGSAGQLLDASGEVDILDQWRRACCMILVQLSLRTPFGKPLVKVVSGALAEALRRCYAVRGASGSSNSEPSAAMVEVVSTMSILAQQQKLRVGGKVLATLLGTSPDDLFASFLRTVSSLQVTYNVVPFVALLAAALAEEMCDVTQQQSAGAEGEAKLTPATLSKALGMLLSSDLLDASTVRAVLATLLTAVQQQTKKSALPAATSAGIKAAVQCIAQRFAADFEHTVAENLATATADADSATLTQFLADVFSAADMKHHQVTPGRDSSEGSGGGLLLSLTSAIPSVRAQAMAAFATAVSLSAVTAPVPTADVVGLVHAAAQNLLDPLVDVAAAAWTVPVLQRVAAVLSAEEMREVFTSAWGFWSTAARTSSSSTTSTTSPAQRQVRAVLATLEETTVVQKVLAAGSGSDSGAAWVFQTAVGAAVGTFHDSELAQSAARMLKGCATHSASFAVFGSLSLKANSTQETVAKAVTTALLSAKFLQHEGAIALLCAVAARLHCALQNEAGCLAEAAVMSHLLVAATGAVNKASAEVNVLLQAVAPLLMTALHTIGDDTSNNSSTKKNSELLLQATEAFAQLVQSPLNIDASVAKTVVTFSTPVSTQDLGSRLLVTVLTAPSVTVTRHLGSCLNALQGSSCPVWAPLLRLVLASSVPNQAAQLHIPVTARLGALQALGAYLAGVTMPFKAGAGAKTKSQARLSAEDSQLAVLLLAVTLQLSGESSSEHRAVGLMLASRLPALAAHLALPSSSSVVAGALTTEVAARVIKEVCAVLSGRAAIIAVEPFAATTALTAEVFESIDAPENPISGSLCALAAQFGWAAPQYALPIVTAARGAQLASTWPHLSALMAAVQGEADGAVALVDALVTAVRLGYPGAAAEVQASIVAVLVSTVQSNPASQAGSALKQQLVGLVLDGLFAAAGPDTRSALYDALLQEQVQRPGQKNILQALAAVHVSLTASAKLLTNVLNAFGTQYKQLTSAGASTAMEVEGTDEGASGDDVISGLSAPLQQILAVLEAVAAAFSSASAESDGALLGALSARLFDFLAQLNDPRLRSVMLVDYCKALAMDAVHTALTVAGKHALTSSVGTEVNGGSKNSASAGKKGTTKDANSSDATAYALSRVDSDIRLLLNCITSTKASTVQASSLRLLKVLLAVNPASVVPSMQALGELLAASSAHMQAGKEGLVEQILRTFVAFLPEAGASTGSEATVMPQYLLQSLCQHFYVMPHHRRGALLKMALSAMKAPATLAVATNLLLVHSFVAHEIEMSAAAGSAQGNNGSDATASGDVMVLLSKSAHRRAQREMKASVPEELFSLATELMLMRTPNTQVNVIIALLGGAHRLLDVALGNTADSAAAAGTAGEDSLLDITASVDYCHTLLRAHTATNSSVSTTDGQRGHAATLAILHLELIVEILENKTFHQLLVTAMDSHSSSGGSGGAAIVQEYFMSFADGVLQLLAMSSAVEQGLGAGRTKELLTLRVDGTQLRLPPKALGKHISGWCYEALRTLQRLMDGPSFVAILQELIDHERMEVRQKALVILGERLEGMTMGKLKDDTEIDLYLDLNAHLRQVVQSFLPTLKTAASAHALPADFHQQSGLAQSALMCIDVLARFLGKRLDWGDIITETLEEVVALNATLVALVNPVAPAASTESATDASKSAKKAKKNSTTAAAAVVEVSAALQTEYCKLLGSSTLCAATLCTVLGAKSLPHLPTIMGQSLGTLEGTGAHVVAGPAVVGSSDAGAEEAHALWRTRVLLARSLIAAVGIVVAQLSKFSHPYIPRILTAALSLEGLSDEHHERATLREDVDRCLSTLATKIPARLSIPLFLQSAPSILGAGHCAAARFADLMAEVWQLLDRPTVVAHLGELSSLATLLLDYRRVFGDQSPAVTEVDAAASDAVVELCLKLTESELKSFLTKLAEWRDVKFKLKQTADGAVDPTQEWRKYARAVSYFSLADALMGKLKSLFIPIMGVLWGSAISLLEAFASAASKAATASKKALTLTDNNGSSSSNSNGKGTKRKEAEGADTSSADQQAQSTLLAEFELLGRYVLSSVRECCAQDSAGFVDEIRFEKMMQAVVSLLPLLPRAFPEEGAYLRYCEDYVGACLSALAVAVGRDLLWKPLNHKILLLTRDPKKAVRVAAVKVLHRLFSEVGEEYLLLLPECLPFLSELMEDANRDVVAAAADAIRFVEELSGEKLDEFLQ